MHMSAGTHTRGVDSLLFLLTFDVLGCAGELAANSVTL